jgi:CRISPR-associated protein Csx17
MNDHVLHGCTPTPLASYLKALAVLRLVAEQAGDPEATGCWQDDTFVLRTRLSRDELLEFFLERYEPTPLVAPWNGGSGFHPKDNKAGIEPLAVTTSPRFLRYRRAIQIARDCLARRTRFESTDREPKRLLLEVLRNEVDLDALRWLDAAVVLSDNDTKYPPLLGTGGNDGRLDFTNNFMQRVAEVVDVQTGGARSGASELLRAALTGSPTSSLTNRAIGQFAPGSAGGPNSTSGFGGDSAVNPWEFILMLEGAVLLAGSAVRRLESGTRAVLSAPFTVRTRAATVGSAAACDDADARGEIWMPLWAKPVTIDELTVLFGEGRAALGTRSAQDGLDFARAVARLGVDRGIASFQRFGLLMRSGKAFLATPIARVPVRRNVQGDLVDDLDQGEWLGRAQRAGRDENYPQSFRTLAARLDASLFAMVRREDRNAVEATLRLLARLEALASVSPRGREQVRPIPLLSDGWLCVVDDDSSEFRIALALARLALPENGSAKRGTIGLRPQLAPVSPDCRQWDENSRLVSWGPGTLDRNLAQVLHRRRLEAIRRSSEGEVLASRAGASLSDVACFLGRDTDDRRIAELAHGLSCVQPARVEAPAHELPIALPPAYVFLKPFFTSNAVLHRLAWLPDDRTLHLPPEIPARLAVDDVAAALRLAWQRLRALGVRLPGREPPSHPRCGDGPRLLAALMIPLTFGETRRLLNRLGLEPAQPIASRTEPDSATTD